MCRGSFNNIPMIKYADDTSIQGLIKTDKDVDNYFMTVNNFVN